MTQASVTALSAEPVAPFDDVTRFFLGRVTATGVFEDRRGTPRRRFSITIDGHMTGDALILDEDFAYDDGARERRRWTFLRKGDRFTATAADCIGEARGEIGPGFWHMRYGFMLRLHNRMLPVAFDDRLYIIDGHTALNRATMRKWGVTLGTVLIVYQRDRSAQTRDVIRPHMTAA
jgi:hypothetical protein